MNQYRGNWEDISVSGILITVNKLAYKFIAYCHKDLALSGGWWKDVVKMKNFSLRYNMHRIALGSQNVIL